MQPYYFAGAIFTAQEVALFLIAAFLVMGIVVGLTLFVIKKLTDKVSVRSKRVRFNLGKAVLVGCGLIAVSALIFLIIPTMVKDARWQEKQEVCARRAGYQSPADNNSGLATADSQDSYRRCLGV